MLTERYRPFPPLLRIEEVAELLNCSVAAVHQPRQRGAMPAALAIKVGRNLRWPSDELEAWLADEKARRPLTR